MQLSGYERDHRNDPDEAHQLDPGNELSNPESKESSDREEHDGSNSSSDFEWLLEQCPGTLNGDQPPRPKPNCSSSELPDQQIIKAQMSKGEKKRHLEGPDGLEDEVPDGPDQAMGSFTCVGCHSSTTCTYNCACPNK